MENNQLEIQLRAMAMDLAVKAYSGEEEGGVIALAESILRFLKGEEAND